MARRRSRKSLALVARKSRRARRMRRNPGYGMVLSRAGSMKLAGVPVLPVVGFGLLGYSLFYVAHDPMESLTRPIVIGGAVVGGLVAYKYGKGWMQKASYVALGTGLGIVIDNYMSMGE